jgi:hypothetical protein
MLGLLFKSFQKLALGLDYRLTETTEDDSNPLKYFVTRTLLFWSGIDLKKPFTHTSLFIGTVILVFGFYLLFALLPSKSRKIV